MPVPEPVWAISVAAAALLTGKEGVVRLAMDWNMNVKFTLQQAMKAQKGIEVQVYSFFNLCA